MADLSLIKIWELDKNGWYKGDGCSIPEEARNWLPVTQYVAENKRVTVRAPYPIGDYDQFKAMPSEDRDCPQCAGTGYTLDGQVCTACKGTGANSETSGAIMVDDYGVIHLQIDNATLGVDYEGKLFARVKTADKGGLAFDADDALYVKIDDRTLKVDANGQLYAVNNPHYSADVSYGQAEPSVPMELFNSIPDDVPRVKLHVDIVINNDADYSDAVELTRFVVAVGTDEPAESDIYCFDQTVPYTIINYDTLVDVDASRSIVVTIAPVDGDTFPQHAVIKLNANIISC